MPITPNTSSNTILAHEYGPRTQSNTTSSKFTLSAPPPPRKHPRQRRPSQANPIANSQLSRNANSPACLPRSSPNRRRSSSARPLSPRSPFSTFISLVDAFAATRTARKGSAYEIGLGVPGARLSPTTLDTIRLFASGKSQRRSVSGPVPCTALSFETHFEPSSEPTGAPAISGLVPSSPVATPIHVLFQRARSLSALKAKTSVSPSSPTKPKSKTKARPTPIMASTKNGHVNVLLLPKPRDRDGAPSIRSNTSASTSTSKSKSRKAPELQSRQGSTSSSKTPRPAQNPALRAQRSLTPARGVANDAFRPLPYATHAALDEFFGDPRKMNALHAHQSTSDQLGARPGEVGYGATVGHMGADGWIWFDALEEQEYAWLMAEAGTPVAPEMARNERKEKKKPKKRGLFGRRGSTASESSGGKSDWESFDALRRGSESGTSDNGIVDPMTFDLDPTRPPRYRAAPTDSSARYKTTTLDVSAWDAAARPQGRNNVGGATTPKPRRGRSRRGSVNRDRSVERRRPPPLNLAAVSTTLANIGPPAPELAAIAARRPSLPAPRLPPSLADAARADFVSSSYQPHPSKRNLNLDPETPWSANLPQETIFRSMGPVMGAPSPAPASPFKAMFARRGSLTPLPLRHTPMPLPQSNLTYEFKTGPSGSLPKLPPMPMENGAVAPEGKRKTSLADIFRKGFGGGKGGRK
ncbi:hypothetical protein BDV93DRAFT_17126 [Ceratobasidium sp. AG-I]|nr:hypothetical protein BDV93DRAFT_17126 [Ceratobasidium sp. AG-I]